VNDSAANASEVPVLAVDGPAGTGKSTVARLVATHLGLEYLDTGAMYRAVTFAVLACGCDLTDTEAVAAAATDADIVIGPDSLDVDGVSVTVDGVDATAAIRGAEVTAAVSMVSAHPVVRGLLQARQRAWATDIGPAVLEGRDIGTAVFPNARLKVYLDARPEVRAARRAAQSGNDPAAELEKLVERDRVDSTRADSPLATAENALVIDTSELAIDEVVEAVADAWREAGHER